MNRQDGPKRRQVSIRIKTWIWALFCFAIDASLQNAWQMYRISEAAQQRPLTLVQFRPDVAMAYIMKYRVTSNLECPVRSQAVTCRTVPDVVRFDGENHFIGHINGGQNEGAEEMQEVGRSSP